MLLLTVAAVLVLADPEQIVRTAVEREFAGASQPRDFVWLTDRTTRNFGGDGKVKSVEQRTTETIIIAGRQFERLIARNGAPLPSAEAAREQRRFDRDVARRQAKSGDERAKEDASLMERDRKAREFLKQVPDLFRFTLAGEDVIRGRKAWRIEATPRPGAKPKGIAAGNIAQLYGKLWIDQESYRWAKVEAEARSTIRFGLFLGSLGPGSRVEFEQAPFGEVWLPVRFLGRLKARLVVKGFNVEDETVYRDYRRFGAESRIIEE